MNTLSLNATTRNAIIAIRAAVREHRDQIGDYRCWADDEVLYHRTLPELRGKKPVVPPTEKFSALCSAYFNLRQNPNEPAADIPLDSSVRPLKLVYDTAILDKDLIDLDTGAVQRELEGWLTRIRKHRETPALQRTYKMDEDLYLALPEKIPAITKLPPRELFLGRGCPNYNRHCQQHPEEFAEGLWTLPISQA